MKTSLLNIFTVVLLFLLAFAIFFALSQSSSVSVFYFSQTDTEDEVADRLVDEGFLRTDYSYYVAKVLFALKGEFEPGGYELRRGLGAVSAFMNLDDPDYKYVYVEEGLRKAEIAEVIGGQLDWNDEEKTVFAYQGYLCRLIGQEGYLAPGEYIIHKDENPVVVKQKMQDAFDKQLTDLGFNSEVVDTSSIVRIASLIQREAYDKNDMNLISGVIYNRLEIGMPLQIDATLQYAKGDEEVWWPGLDGDDKYIESPYNTYENKGLPPAPIATPGVNALRAALNPKTTDCLFYLHDKRGNIHCSTNYAGHKNNVAWYLK
jgi:UPF0755 protein